MTKKCCDCGKKRAGEGMKCTDCRQPVCIHCARYDEDGNPRCAECMETAMLEFGAKFDTGDLEDLDADDGEGYW